MNTDWKSTKNQQNTSLEADNVEFVNFREKDKALNKLQLVGGGEPPNGNWLVDMADGTVFTIQDKMDQTNFTVMMLQIVMRMEKSIRLWNVIEDKLFADVDPYRFVRRFTRLEIIEEPTTEKEETNG